MNPWKMKNYQLLRKYRVSGTFLRQSFARKSNQCLYAGQSLNLLWTEEEHGKFYEKWLNPTHLLSGAHLSNLFFMTGKDQLCMKCEMLFQNEVLVAGHNFE